MLIPAFIFSIKEKNWLHISLEIIAFVLFHLIEIFLFIYYRNKVIDVTFEGDYTIIKTNGKTYKLLSVHSTEVIIARGIYRTYIFYDNGKMKKKFVFL